MKNTFENHWEIDIKRYFTSNLTSKQIAEAIWKDAMYYMKQDIDNLSVPEIKVKSSDFIVWYLEDSDDLVYIGLDLKNYLLANNIYTLTTQELLDRCTYIPSTIVIDYKGPYKEYDSSEVILID